jgi:hypothetical protein
MSQVQVRFQADADLKQAIALERGEFMKGDRIKGFNLSV